MTDNTPRIVLAKRSIRVDLGYFHSGVGSTRGLFLAHNCEQYLAAAGIAACFK